MDFTNNKRTHKDVNRVEIKRITPKLEFISYGKWYD